VSFERDAVYVAGRYNKLSRRISQTPWLIDNHRKTKRSVEEEISDVVGMRFQASCTYECHMANVL
jgi:tRNA pseudouridine synthase 10